MSSNDHTDDSPIAYLNAAGIAYKKASGNELTINCPACGNNEGCQINAKTGLWNCLRASCGAKGGLWKLKELLGHMHRVSTLGRRPAEAPKSEFERDLELSLQQTVPTKANDLEQWQVDLHQSPAAHEARLYLERRRIKSEVMDLCQIGWVQRHPNARPGEPQGGPGAPMVKKPRKRSSEPSAVDPVPEEAAPPPKAAGPGGNGLIVIPYIEAAGAKPHLVKMRHVPPEPLDDKGKVQRFSRLRGGKSTFYAPMGPPVPGKGVLLVGGEFDALSVVQALVSGGCKPPWATVPFIVLGAMSGEAAWNEHCEAMLEPVEDVVLALDSDAGGMKATESQIGKIGRHRCRRARWPDGCKDANEALQKGELDMFTLMALWQNAPPVSMPGVKEVRDLEDEVVSFVFGAPPRGYPTGIRALDDLVGGLRNAEITLVTGQTGAGKSTLCSQIAMFQALDPNGPKRRVLICPFELGARDQTLKLIRQHTQREPYDMTQEDLRQSIRAIDDSGRLLLFDWYGPVELNVLKETLQYAIRRLDVGLIVIDHIHFAVEQTGNESDFYGRLDRMARMLSDLIKISPTHCLLVAQPGKTGQGKDRDDHVVQLGDIRGGAAVPQAANNAWSVYRIRNAARQTDNESDRRLAERGLAKSGIVSLKQRLNLGREGSAELVYDMRTELFHDPRDMAGFDRQETKSSRRRSPAAPSLPDEGLPI